MIPYLVCILPVAFICLFSHKRYSYNKKAILLMLFPLFVLIAFRGISVGSDTQAYSNMFIAMRNNSFALEISYDRLEIGFKILLKVLSAVSDNPQILFIVQALVFYVVFVNFLKKNTFEPARFIVLFLGLNLFNFYLTGVRQTFAMSICILAYQMSKDRKFVSFLLLIALAFMFHKSALFFVAIYPLCSKKINRNYAILDILLIFMVSIFNERLFEIGGTVFDFKYGIEVAQNGYLMVIIVAITTIFSFLYYVTLVRKNPDCAILIQINVLSMAMWVLRLYSRTAERIAFYFLPFTILLMNELLDLPRDSRFKKILNLGSIVFFTLYFIYRLNGVGLLPYQFFWMNRGV